MKKLLPLVLLIAASVGTACARQPTTCQPQVREGWIRMMPNGMPMHGGFGRIENTCGVPVVITAAQSPTYGSIELHETKMVDGVSKMRRVPELRIAPKNNAVLKPGGLHLMLFDPTTQLQPGSKVAVTFKLANGQTLIGEFTVRKPD